MDNFLASQRTSALRLVKCVGKRNCSQITCNEWAGLKCSSVETSSCHNRICTIYVLSIETANTRFYRELTLNDGLIICSQKTSTLILVKCTDCDLSPNVLALKQRALDVYVFYMALVKGRRQGLNNCSLTRFMMK